MTGAQIEKVEHPTPDESVSHEEEAHYKFTWGMACAIGVRSCGNRGGLSKLTILVAYVWLHGRCLCDSDVSFCFDPNQQRHR